MAERPRRHAGLERGRAQAASVEPVVRTSSTSSTQRPRIGARRAGVRRPRRRRARCGPVAPVEVELGDRRPVARERRDVRQPEPRGRDPGDELGLVVAAVRVALVVDRDVDDDLRADARRAPSAARRPRRAARASRCSAPYLMRVQGARVTPVNGAHHSTWRSGAGMSAGSPMGTPGRLAAGRRAPARSARTAAGPRRRQPTQCRQGHVEGPRRGARTRSITLRAGRRAAANRGDRPHATAPTLAARTRCRPHASGVRSSRHDPASHVDRPAGQIASNVARCGG